MFYFSISSDLNVYTKDFRSCRFIKGYNRELAAQIGQYVSLVFEYAEMVSENPRVKE